MYQRFERFLVSGYRTSDVAPQQRLKATVEQNSFKVARELDADAVRAKRNEIKGKSELSQKEAEAEGLNEAAKVDKVNRRLTRILERTEAIEGMTKKQLLEYAANYVPQIYATNGMTAEQIKTNIIRRSL
ncbi:hypothetical protein [Myxosarcina sp. GI1(2024)]